MGWTEPMNDDLVDREWEGKERRCLIGSQCNFLSIGVMCSNFDVFVTTWAKEQRMGTLGGSKDTFRQLSRIMHVVIYLKCLSQIYTKMNGSKFDFSKKFLGGAHWALPRPLPFRTSPSSIIRWFASSIFASLSTFDWRTWFDPKINSRIRPKLAQRLPLWNSWLRLCHNFHCCCRQGRNHWGSGVRTANFFIDPQFWTAFNSFVLNVFLYNISLKSRFFQDFPFNYTPDLTIWSSKFQKFSREGLTEPPPQNPPLHFLRLHPIFGVCPQIETSNW